MGDTNEISKGCLTHYDNRHIQVRLDFLGLCAYDKDLFDEKRKEEPNQECMAKILRLFETLTDHARTGWQLKAINAKEKGLTIPQEPKEYRFELTNGAIISLIYNTFGESTVRNSLDYLIHLGYIGRYQEKKNSIPVYWLNTQKIQPLLKEQAENELSGFEITPQNTKGLKSHPKRPKSNPSPTISNPNPPKSDTSGFESTDNNINNNKDNITEKERNERESPPNIPDTHTIVSGDTAHAEYPLTEFDEKMTVKEAEIRQMLEGVASEEIIQQTIETFRKAVLAHRETRYHELPMPTTYAEAVIYLTPHGGVPPGYDAVQTMKLAQKLYAEAHSQDEEMFTNDEPQGDTQHAATASGHSHRLDDAATPGVDGAGSSSQDRPLATPEARPVLEAQTLAQTSPTSTPAQSLPLPQAEQAALGAELVTHCYLCGKLASRVPVPSPLVCAGCKRKAKQTVQQVDPNRGVTVLQEPEKPNQPEDQKAAKPLVEPDMSGKWSHEKCVEYAEWCNQKRYTEKMHEEQLKAAHAIHKNDSSLTLEQFKQAYDERNDPWWKEHKGKLHVNDMKARGASGIDRVHEMLQRIEDAASKCRAQTPRVLVPAPSPNQPITNIRELVRQRELLRQQQAVGV